MRKLYRFGYGLVDTLASLALALLAVLNLFFGVTLIASEKEMVIARNGFTFFLSLALWGAAATALVKSGRAAALLERLSTKKLFAACALLYGAAGLWLLLGTDQTHMVYDTAAVFSAAEAFRAHDFAPLDAAGYVGRYPFQLSLVMIVEALQHLSASPVFFRAINLLCVIGVNGLLAGFCPGGKFARNLTVILSFLFVPQLFSLLFIYGNIPSALFMLLAAAALLRALDSGKAGWYAASVALLSAAYLLRTNMLIAAIAFAAVCVMHVLHGGKKRALPAAACFLVVPLLAAGGVRAHYSRESGRAIGPGIPSAAWIVMGMSEGEGANGWYNGYTDQVYNAHGHDGLAAKGQVMDDLKERLYDFKKDPGMAARFYGEKLVSTWCEPTFESLAIHMIQPETQCYTPALKSLFGGELFQAVHELLHGLVTVLYALAAINPLLRRRNKIPGDGFTLLALIYLIGGFAFHILWETKSLYVSVYVLPLIPVAAQSVGMLRGAQLKKDR